MNILEIINKLQSLNMIRIHKQTGNYMTIYCPFHSDGNEKKPSCGILLTDEHRGGQKYPAGWTHCFSCGYAKDLPTMIGDLLNSKNIGQSGLDWLQDNIPGFDRSAVNFDYLMPDDLMAALTATYAVSYVQSKIKPATAYVSEEELASYRFTVPYMYDRKLTDAIIERFDIGYDAAWIAPGRKHATPCITFPVRDINGNTLFFCRRSIEGKFFNYPEGVVKPVYGLYELPDEIKSVVICESCFNALTSWVYGKPAVALMGTGNAYQIQQLKELGVRKFILAFDPDEAGARATAKLKRALRSAAIVWSYTGIPAGKDINDLTQDEYNALELE